MEKDPVAGKDWRQEEKETMKDEMVGWHHGLNGHEFEQAPEDGEGHGSLACYRPWGCKELDITELLNNKGVCCAHLVLSVSLTPWTVIRQAPLFMEFSRQEYWSGLPFPTPGDLPNLWLTPMSFGSPLLAGGFFIIAPPNVLQIYSRVDPWTTWRLSHWHCAVKNMSITLQSARIHSSVSLILHLRIVPTEGCVVLWYVFIEENLWISDLCRSNPCCSRVKCNLWVLAIKY